MAHIEAEYCASVWSRSSHTLMLDTTSLCTLHIISSIPCQRLSHPWLPVLLIVSVSRSNNQTSCKHPNESQPSTLLGHHVPAPDRLPSRQPIWLDCPGELTSTRSEWGAQWSSAEVVNLSLVTDPAICLLLVSIYLVVYGLPRITSELVVVVVQQTSSVRASSPTQPASVELQNRP